MGLLPQVLGAEIITLYRSENPADQGIIKAARAVVKMLGLGGFDELMDAYQAALRRNPEMSDAMLFGLGTSLLPLGATAPWTAISHNVTTPRRLLFSAGIAQNNVGVLQINTPISAPPGEILQLPGAGAIRTPAVTNPDSIINNANSTQGVLLQLMGNVLSAMSQQRTN